MNKDKEKQGKKPEPYCKNCLLFDKSKKECKVNILIEGEHYNMPVEPNDRCVMDLMAIEVKQVRWFVEDQNGKPAENGKVKIEYPVDFFKKDAN